MDPDFPMTAEDLIHSLRGGPPETCDFCLHPMKPEDAIPEEAGEWCCRLCWDYWEANDGKARPIN